jgi:Glycoside Hydrolase Family 113
LWNTLIANFHGVFSGTLTYDTNWTTLKVTPARWLHNVDLKMIGVSAYFPLVDTPSRVDPKRANELWKSKVRNVLDQFKAAVNKPIFISEIGYRSTADAFYRPYAQKSAASFDPEEQAAAYNAALINTIHDPNIAGIFFWAWDNVDALSIHDLPATATLHSWYNSPDA